MIGVLIVFLCELFVLGGEIAFTQKNRVIGDLIVFLCELCVLGGETAFSAEKQSNRRLDCVSL